MNRFCCVSEKEKFDELFVADEQDYEYESITVLKKRLILASDFDIDNIILTEDDQKAFMRKATMLQRGQTVVEGKESFQRQQTLAQKTEAFQRQQTLAQKNEALKKQQTMVAAEPIKEESENPNDRSVEVLSDSSEEDTKPVDPKVKEEREKVARMIANTKAGNHDTSNEKPMDVFKNLFTEFKPFIPSKENKEPEAAPKKKPGFFSTARSFFGL